MPPPPLPPEHVDRALLVMVFPRITGEPPKTPMPSPSQPALWVIVLPDIVGEDLWT
jgi:hypothetical protein